MKKFLITLILCLTTICSFAQKPNLCIYNGYYNGYTDIYAGYNSKNEVILWVRANNTDGDADISYFGVVGKKKITSFSNELIFIKEKLIEYDKVANENDITEFSKVICEIKSFNNINMFLWDHAYHVGACQGNKLLNYPKAKYIISGRTRYVLIYGWYTMTDNQFVQVYSSLRIDLDNVDEYIEIFNGYDEIVNKIDESNNVQNLFN